MAFGAPAGWPCPAAVAPGLVLGCPSGAGLASASINSASTHVGSPSPKSMRYCSCPSTVVRFTITPSEPASLSPMSVLILTSWSSSPSVFGATSAGLAAGSVGANAANSASYLALISALVINSFNPLFI